jgi:hypothetical protein
MHFDYIVSLGASCTAAYQIRSYFGQEIAFPFDWLITPWSSMIELVTNGFVGFIDEEHLAPYKDYFSIMNTKHPILHHHDFSREEGVVTPRWKDEVANVRGKYDYLCARWERVLDGCDSVLFVRHQGHNHLDDELITRISVPEANSFCSLLEDKFHNLRFSVLFASAVAYDPQHVLHSKAIVSEVRYTDFQEWPDPLDYWRGCTLDWKAVFDRILEMPE